MSSLGSHSQQPLPPSDLRETALRLGSGGELRLPSAKPSFDSEKLGLIVGAGMGLAFVIAGLISALG